MNPFFDKTPPVVIVPELFRVTGGVQIFSRRMIEALDEIYGQAVPIISRNDRKQDFPADFLKGRPWRGCGNSPEALRKFALMGASLFNRAPYIVSTHPHFTPWLKLRRKPYFCVTHGIDVWNIRGSRIVDGLRSAKAILPVSQYTAERMTDQMGSSDLPPVEIFPNTFDARRFYPAKPRTKWRADLDIPKDAIVMLSMCRVSLGEEGKGYHRLLDLMPRLLKANPGLFWVLGGKGNDLENVRRKARKLGVSDHCRFPGFVADESLPDLYRSSDLFVLPSKKEGFGIVFLEAAATGLPVIAGNKDGSVDALAHGALGHLVDPENDDEICEMILRVIDEPKRDRRILHDDCASRFGKDAFRDRLAEILTKHNS